MLLLTATNSRQHLSALSLVRSRAFLVLFFEFRVVQYLAEDKCRLQRSKFVSVYHVVDVILLVVSRADVNETLLVNNCGRLHRGRDGRLHFRFHQRAQTCSVSSSLNARQRTCLLRGFGRTTFGLRFRGRLCGCRFRGRAVGCARRALIFDHLVEKRITHQSFLEGFLLPSPPPIALRMLVSA